jgi:hypothetical protein
MSYRVVWRERVRQRLGTSIFVAREQGRDTVPIKRAVSEIDRRLAADPDGEGESRGGRERVLIAGPLPAFYEAFPESGTVLVYAAVLYPGQTL